MSGKYTVTVRCGHDGCQEWRPYAADTRSEARELSIKQGSGQWRCARHARMHELLSVDHTTKTYDMTAIRRPHGMYWGKNGSGFQSGPGFRAFAKDFPEGTILRVTAEIIVPDADTTP